MCDSDVQKIKDENIKYVKNRMQISIFMNTCPCGEQCCIDKNTLGMFFFNCPGGNQKKIID